MAYYGRRIMNNNMNYINPIQTRDWGGGGGLLRPATKLKMCYFKTIKDIITKLGDYLENSVGNILTLLSHLCC